LDEIQHFRNANILTPYSKSFPMSLRMSQSDRFPQSCKNRLGQFTLIPLHERTVKTDCHVIVFFFNQRQIGRFPCVQEDIDSLEELKRRSDDLLHNILPVDVANQYACTAPQRTGAPAHCEDKSALRLGLELGLECTKLL
jgi:hypothetical protein